MSCSLNACPGHWVNWWWNWKQWSASSNDLVFIWEAGDNQALLFILFVTLSHFCMKIDALIRGGRETCVSTWELLSNDSQRTGSCFQQGAPQWDLTPFRDIPGVQLTGGKRTELFLVWIENYRNWTASRTLMQGSDMECHPPLLLKGRGTPGHCQAFCYLGREQISIIYKGNIFKFQLACDLNKTFVLLYFLSVHL